MGKTELYASCVNSIVDILSQKLVIQCHDNKTFPDLANVLQKNPDRFYRNMTLKPSLPVSLSIRNSLSYYRTRTVLLEH